MCLKCLALSLFLLVGDSFAVTEWDLLCTGMFQVARSGRARDFFVAGIDFEALRAPLLAEGKATIAPRDQITAQIRFSRGHDGKYLLELLEGRDTVSTLRFTWNADARRIYIENARTNDPYTGQAAGDALVRTAFAIFPTVKTAGAQLALVNFRKVAESIANRTIVEMPAAEKVVEDALRASDKTPVVTAVGNSPTGRPLRSVGFVVVPSSLQLVSAEYTEDRGPLLTVEWARP